MKHFITLTDLRKQDLVNLLQLAKKLKFKKKGTASPLSQKTLIMLFQKTSTRTRLSFEVAMTQLGGHAIYVDARTSQLSLADFSDEIRAIMRYGDILLFRARKASDVVLASSYGQIPVIDGCSEKYHPCQALSDMLTMVEDAGSLKNIKKIAWLGIQNNVSNSLSVVCSILGIHLTIISPKRHTISIDKDLDMFVNRTGFVEYTTNIKDGLRGVQYVHTDTWMDMEFFDQGKIQKKYEKEFKLRKRIFRPYQLSAALLTRYAPQAKIMHCMPCHVGYEITRDAIDHPHSLIFTQAENRLHMQKACLVWLYQQQK